MLQYITWRKAFTGLFLAVLLVIPACESTDRSGVESLTGERQVSRAPRFEPHSKGGQWGRVVYDRSSD
ncbi:MAG: hypothetical protein AMXMBFR13_35410 [Phycisphaerae bacterium]